MINAGPFVSSFHARTARHHKDPANERAAIEHRYHGPVVGLHRGRLFPAIGIEV
jgi:hypothetical protein